MSLKFIPITLPKGNIIIRARINIPFNIEYGNITELSYPPVKKAELMRANLKGQQVFYGSVIDKSESLENDLPRMTTLYEISKFARELDKDGIQVITYGIWVNSVDLQLAAVPVLNEFENPINLISLIQDFWLHKIKTEDATNIQQLKNISSQFCNSTKEPNSCYLETSDYTNKIFEENPLIDGILYPSTQLKGRGLCIAIKKETVDKSKIKFKECLLCNFVNRDKRPILFHFKRGKENRGRIEYKRCDEGEYLSFVKIKQGLEYIDR